MQITTRIAKLLLRLHQGDLRPLVDEYLGGLLVEVRKRQDNAQSTEDMLRAQGQARLLVSIFKDVDGAQQTLHKLEQQQRRTP